MFLRLTIPFVLMVFLAGQSHQTGRHRRQGGSAETCTTPRQVPGVCVDIRNCSLHLDYLLNRRKEPEILKYLQDALCYKQGSQIITCCPEEKSGNSSRGESCLSPRGASGQCINIKNCQEMMDLLKNRSNRTVSEYIRDSKCGFEGRVPKVCCPTRTTGVGGGVVPNGGGGVAPKPNGGGGVAPKPNGGGGVAPKPNGGGGVAPKPNGGGGVATKPNGGGASLPGLDVCGRNGFLPDRVVKGRPADLGSWPWMVALGYRTTNKPLKWRCGGSLISNRYVLTAAHCVTNLGRWTLYLARVGDLDLEDSVMDKATPIDVPVQKIIPHESFNPRMMTVDIALIKLRDPVQFTQLIRPICLPTADTFELDLVGYTPFITGWGATSFRGPSVTHLQEAQLEITDMESCAEAYPPTKGALIDDRVICASSNSGQDACQGDSGGPLALPSLTQKVVNYFLIGVVSFGHKCAEKGFPGVYTKVSVYIDWIKKNMD